MQWTPILALLSLMLLMPAMSMSATPPNVIVILTDDQGWGDLSINGNTNLATPHTDSLGRDGAVIERFYVQPVCSPTRAEFFTGRYHPRTGVHGVTSGDERLNLDEQTIADIFKAAGYATGAFGKWHNGTQWPYHPNARGFDEFYGFTSGHWGIYFDPPLDHNGQLVTGRGFIADDCTDQAIDFIERNRDRPFFCYVPYNTPHGPMQVPDRFYEKFANAELKLRGRGGDREDLEHTRAALAMCENMDWNVGRILQRLDELKLAENTIVVFFCDNGPNGGRYNGQMKGIKGSTDEGGVRSPFLMRWPTRIRPGTRIETIAAAIDLLPTLAQCAGIELRPAKPLDGISLKPLLLGESAAAEQVPDERMIFSHWRGNVAVRTQRYLLDHEGQLFDLIADPGQQRDIASEHRRVADELAGAVKQWRQEMLVEHEQDDRPFTVGYRDMPMTQLPARDGVPHGNVERSSRHPNCSFFTNWTGHDDRITWDIDVATAGEYEAVIYYTCPVADVGSTIELSFREASVQATVAEPHDPPLMGAEHDRVPRNNSYVKDFKPMRVGTLRLPAGRGTLTLRALDIPGKQVMDVRMIVLTLQ